MSVQIYGKTYAGSQYKDIEKMTENLFPGRDINKPPKNNNKKKIGEPSILEWLRIRNERAKERVEKGLPARKPLYVSPEGDEDDISVLSGESAQTSILSDESKLAPLHKELVSLECYPPWSMIVPRLNDSEDHLEATHELRQFRSFPTDRDGTDFMSNDDASDGKSKKSKSTKHSGSKKSKSSRTKSEAAVSKSTGGRSVSSNGSKTIPSRRWSLLKTAAKFTGSMVVAGGVDTTKHLVGLSGALKPLHSGANMSWFDIEQALLEREKPVFLDDEKVNPYINDEDYCFRPLNKSESLLEMIAEGKPKTFAQLIKLIDEVPSDQVVLASVRRGMLEFIEILSAEGAYLGLEGGSGFEYDGVSRVRKTSQELKQEEVQRLRERLEEKKQKGRTSPTSGLSVASGISSNSSGKSGTSKNWSIARTASKVGMAVRRTSQSSRRSSIGEECLFGDFRNDFRDSIDVSTGGFPNLVSNPRLKSKIQSMDAEDLLIALNMMHPATADKPSSPVLSPAYLAALKSIETNESKTSPAFSPSVTQDSPLPAPASPLASIDDIKEHQSPDSLDSFHKVEKFRPITESPKSALERKRSSSLSPSSSVSSSSFDSNSQLPAITQTDPQGFTALELVALRRFVTLNRLYFPPKYRNNKVNQSFSQDEQDNAEISPPLGRVSPVSTVTENTYQDGVGPILTPNTPFSTQDQHRDQGDDSIPPSPQYGSENKSPSPTFHQRQSSSPSSRKSPKFAPAISNDSISDKMKKSNHNQLLDENLNRGDEEEVKRKELEREGFEDVMSVSSQHSQTGNVSHRSYGSGYLENDSLLSIEASHTIGVEGYGGYVPPSGETCVKVRRQVYKEKMEQRLCGVRYYKHLKPVESMTPNQLIRELVVIHQISVETKPRQKFTSLNVSNLSELAENNHPSSTTGVEESDAQVDNDVYSCNSFMSKGQIRGDGAEERAMMNSLKRHLHGRNLFARVFALEQLGGYSLLHMATHLGYTGVAMRLLFHEDRAVGYEDQSESLVYESHEAASQGGIDNAEQTHQQQQRGKVSTMVRPRRMLDGRDRLGCTPLHNACVSSPHFRQLKVIKALLDRGADVNAVDNRGRTPLHYACRSVDEGAIALLLSHGADVTIKSEPYPWQCIQGGSPYNPLSKQLPLLPKQQESVDPVKDDISKSGGNSYESKPSPMNHESTLSVSTSGGGGGGEKGEKSSKKNKKNKTDVSSANAVLFNENFEYRSGGRHKGLGSDFGVIQGQGCGSCVLAARPEDRNEVYAMLAAGIEERELRAMHASMISRTFVQELLNGFIRYDPVTHRSLHKTHAIRQNDGSYFLHISNRPPRGKWSDPRPGK